MKFSVSCHNKIADSYFNDIITINSLLITSLECGAGAIASMYAAIAPHVDVLGVTQLIEVERGFC